MKAVACLAVAVAACVAQPSTTTLVVPQVLGIDLDKIKPTGPGKVTVDRGSLGPIEFSVVDALPKGHKFRTYWFVNFDFAAPKLWNQVTDPLKLDPCQEPLAEAGGFQTITTVEVLITEGTLDISVLREGDPRFTPGGEPVVPIRWTVIAEGKCPHQ